MTESQTRLLTLIRELSERPIAYMPAYARLANSVTAGVFLSQAMYWTPRGSAPYGWFYKTAEEWTAETALSYKEQATARKKLREIGVLEEKRMGVPARLWYRVDLERVSELLLETQDSNRTSIAESAELEPGTEAPVTTGVVTGGESGDQDFPKAAVQTSPKRRTTTESTADSIVPANAGTPRPRLEPRAGRAERSSWRPTFGNGEAGNRRERSASETGSTPETFAAWLERVRQSDNPVAALRRMIVVLYPGREVDDYGRIGQTMRRVGGPERLAQLLWETSTRPPVGSVLDFVERIAAAARSNAPTGGRNGAGYVANRDNVGSVEQFAAQAAQQFGTGGLDGSKPTSGT